MASKSQRKLLPLFNQSLRWTQTGLNKRLDVLTEQEGGFLMFGFGSNGRDFQIQILTDPLFKSCGLKALAEPVGMGRDAHQCPQWRDKAGA